MYAYKNILIKYANLGSVFLKFFQNRCTTYPIVIWNENPKSKNIVRSYLIQGVDKHANLQLSISDDDPTIVWVKMSIQLPSVKTLR